MGTLLATRPGPLTERDGGKADQTGRFHAAPGGLPSEAYGDTARPPFPRACRGGSEWITHSLGRF